MKIKVVKSFRDRENELVLRTAGEELEVTPERGRDLIAKGFVVEVKPKQEKKTKKEN